MLLSKIVSSLIEIIVLSTIPFIWWFFTSRKKESFFTWIGLKKTETSASKKVIPEIAFIFVAYVVVSLLILYIMKDTETAISEFSGLGIKGILPALVYAIFNTSLPEEILFRGFLLKRIQHRFGFIPANIIQSIIFGLMHGVMFFLKVDVVKTLLIILFTSSVAYFMGDINENKFSGSIFPSWIIHALSNTVPAFIALFTVL